MSPLSRPVHQVDPLCSRMVGTEALSLLTEHSFPRHSHDHLGIGIITSGAQRSWSLVGHVEAGPGDVIIVNPSEIHDGIPLDGPRAWQMVYIQPEILKQELAAEGRSADAVLQPLVRDRLLGQCLLRLFNEMSLPVAENTALEEMFLFSLMHVSRYHMLSERYQHARCYSAQRAKEYLDDMSEHAVTLGELASLCDLSRFQLLRSFSREIGITPHAYLLQRRVCHARRYLLEGNTLIEAALRAGFADQSHMTRAFVRQLGITPSRYQKAILS
ncbi:AraC family transcriptional regulator [Acinetobacter sp. V91_7]|uniref:helix-turn-helix transcriptional regulator n=1 Tax=unclassified Acinetobacter TaxID=196816 RepID=UPI00287C2F98|nr:MULTISPECIES: AraC family transcriptional regulator [unclassified Acinetobacter]MDS7935550.1 AraC family transcriptional regulator [Acinetobacter sp. V91_4B]MDS7964842.1 AraC family transcriptional regulator [Acinetobacter sp. V91_7]MDS8025463.1 AraC family transcriptional regulator [Acinetobacter sp. V91_13]